MVARALVLAASVSSYVRTYIRRAAKARGCAASVSTEKLVHEVPHGLLVKPSGVTVSALCDECDRQTRARI